MSSEGPSTSLKYATNGGLDLYIEYIVPKDATREKKAPIFLWFHGGGLLQGTRYGWPHHWAKAPENHGLCVISADYRLAPQTRIPGIMKDCSDLMAFIRSSEFEQATEGRVDSSKICIGGASAGGWLALLVGMGIGFEASGTSTPAPATSIAALYPITDLNDKFWHTKQHPVSYMPRVIKDEEVAQYLDPNSTPLAFSSLSDPRSIFYHYMIQEAILENLLLDGTNIPPSAYTVAKAIKDKSCATPPTYVIHGTIDDKVPIVQAEDVVNAMKERNLDVTFEKVEGADHLYDRDEKEDMEAMYQWIKKTLA